MKKHTILLAVALLTAGTLATGCSSDDAAVGNPIQQTAATGEMAFSATIAPKSNSTRSVDADGVTTWVSGEQIAVYYEKTDNSHATATATVGTPNADGSAPITATLSGAKNGGEVKFVYPATLANTEGDIDVTQLYNDQHGNLTGATGISKLFDAATTTGTIVVSGTTATVSGNIKMENKVCICKMRFHLDVNGGTPIQDEFQSIVIDDGDGHFYTITSDKPDDYVGGVTRKFRNSDDIYVAMLPVSGKTVTFYHSHQATSGYNNFKYTSANTTLTAGMFYRNIGTINLLKEANVERVTYKDLSAGNITAATGDIIWQSTFETANTITIPDGVSVTIRDVKISALGLAGITCEGDATIMLEGVNSIFSDDHPAIEAGPAHKTLTIDGSGSLTAGSRKDVGIGCDNNSTCGNIVITCGTVMATGGYCSAGIGSSNTSGIGGGQSTSCGNITISGSAQVTANGGNNGAAGIGCGNESCCGTITICGSAQVTANGSGYGAGIGSGYANSTISTCGTITISGSAQVTANGGKYGAGIGSGYAQGGYASTCGDILISGGTVEATGGENAVGIGSGQGGNSGKSECGDITITSGVTKVTATRGSYATMTVGRSISSYDCGIVTIGGTEYWGYDTDIDTHNQNWKYKNGGDTYLTQNPFVYQPTH